MRSHPKNWMLDSGLPLPPDLASYLDGIGKIEVVEAVALHSVKLSHKWGRRQNKVNTAGINFIRLVGKLEGLSQV